MLVPRSLRFCLLATSSFLACAPAPAQTAAPAPATNTAAAKRVYTAADFARFAPMLARVRARGLRAIAGLVHHGSGPMHTHLLDPEFEHGLARYARRVAEAHPWITDFTPVNEPLTTARFSGLYGVWHPHGKDEQTFLHALFNQCRGIALARVAGRDVRRPGARGRKAERGVAHRLGRVPAGLRPGLVRGRRRQGHLRLGQARIHLRIILRGEHGNALPEHGRLGLVAPLEQTAAPQARGERDQADRARNRLHPHPFEIVSAGSIVSPSVVASPAARPRKVAGAVLSRAIAASSFAAA